MGRDISLDKISGVEKQLQQVTDPADRQKYTVFQINSAFLDMDLYAYISNKTVYKDLDIYRNIFFICLIMVMAMTACYIFSIYVVINSPIKILVSTIEQMEKGNLGVRIQENGRMSSAMYILPLTGWPNHCRTSWKSIISKSC